MPDPWGLNRFFRAALPPVEEEDVFKEEDFPGLTPSGPGTYTSDIGGGYMGIWTLNDKGVPVLRQVFKGSADGGGGVSSAERAAALAEDIRHNRAIEAISLKQMAVDAASKAMQGYMEATQQVSARRKGAFEESRELLPFLVDPSQRFFSGLEPTGALATAAQRFGLPFSPVPIQHKQLAPAMIASEPTIDPIVLQMLQGIIGAPGGVAPGSVQ